MAGGRRQYFRVMRTSRIHHVVSVVCLAGATLAIGGGGVVAQAADVPEVFSFETSPGIVRASVPVSVLDADGVSGLLYVVEVEPGRAGRLVEVDPGPSGSGITPQDNVRALRAATLDDGFTATDIDVSRDGRTVVIGSATGTISFDRATLSEIGRTDVPAREVVASPDRPDRFLASNGNDDTVVVDGAGTISLVNVISERRSFVDPPFTWGSDSSSVIGIDSPGLGRVSLTDAPEIGSPGPPPFEDAKSLTVQGDRLLWRSTFYDIATLQPTGTVPDSPVASSEGSSTVALRGRDGDWAAYTTTDVSAPPRRWSFPYRDAIDEWASLADGRIAIVESGYLSIADPHRLDSAYGEFHPVQPARVLDTRVTGKLGAGQQIPVQLAGRGGLPADGVLAVVLNATVGAPTARSYFSVWPTGVDRPEVSNLNFDAGQTIANSVTVAVGANGAVNLSNEFGSAHAILDVVGYYSTEVEQPGARYLDVPATRLRDTRLAPRETGRIGPGQTTTVSIDRLDLGRYLDDGDRVVGVALNVTSVRPTSRGYLTVWPAGTQRPVASSLNFEPGDTRANLVVVGVGADGESVDIFNSSGSTHVLVDVFGLYVLPYAQRLDQQGRLLPIEPFRSFDSRVDSPFDGSGRIPENASVIFRNARGWTDIVNATAVNPTSDGFLSVLGFDPDADNTAFPATSNVNFRAGETVANAAYAVGAPLTEVYNPYGETHLVVDRFGYLTPEIQRPVEEVWGP